MTGPPPVRRRFHRLAADEFHRASRARWPRATEGDRHRGARDRHSRDCARTAPARSSSSACGPSMSASTTARAARRGLRRRISRHDADRDRHAPRAGRLKARLPASDRACSAGEHGRPTLPGRPAVDLRRAHPAGRSAPRFTSGGGRMAEVALSNVTKRFRHVDGRRGPVARRSPTASSSCCSGRPAPARRRRLRLVAGLETADTGEVWIGGRDVTQVGAGGARRRLRVPAIFALSASVRLRQPRLPVALAGAAHAGGPRSKRGSSEIAELLRIDAQAAEPGDAALRRRDAARRDRPRAGAPARHLSHGRAAVLARRQAARRAAARAQAHPAGSRRDDPLCHA